MAKKILVVSPFFAPENSVASIRFTKIVKYFIQHGHDVTVLCTQMTNTFLKDDILERDLAQIPDVIRIKYPQFLYYKLKMKFGLEGAQKKKTEPSAEKKNANKMLQHLYMMLNWSYSYLCDMMLARRFWRYMKRRENDYDVLITTFNPFASHLFGEQMKRVKGCKCWIADFRDPVMSFVERDIVTRYITKRIMHAVGNADYITTVSYGCKNTILGEASQFGFDYEDKIRVITNGFDAEEKSVVKVKVPQKRKLVFSFCGTIYKVGDEVKYDFLPFFKALYELGQEDKICIENIEIIYAGNSYELLEEQAKEYGMDKLIQNMGFISRNEALEIEAACDICLLAIWNDRKNSGILTGKFFELLMLEKNILCLVKGDKPNSELGSIIKDVDCGYVYEKNESGKSDFDGLKNWIYQSYAAKMLEGKILYHGDEKKVMKFSHANLAKQFETLF